MIALVVASWALMPRTAIKEPGIDSSAMKAWSSRIASLTIEEIQTRAELTHSLLRANGGERIQAAKIAKAPDAWEPTLKTETEGERCRRFNLTNRRLRDHNSSNRMFSLPWEGDE